MKKFHFTLERMLDYKDQILEREKMTLGQIKRRQAEIEDDIDRLNRKSRRLSEDLRREEAKGTTVMMIMSYSSQIENIRFQIKDLTRQLEDVRKQAESQLKVVIGASQEVSGLEKLQERQLDEYRLEEQRANRENILEYVITQMSYSQT